MALLKTDRGTGHPIVHAATERSSHMTRENERSGWELEQTLVEGIEQRRCTFKSVDGQVGASDIADEEGITSQDQPRFRTPRAVDDGDDDMLGTVPRRVDGTQHDLTKLELVTVAEREVRVGSAG